MDDLQLQKVTAQERRRLTPAVRIALAQLGEAGNCARDAGRDPWEFAVEIGTLGALGVTAAALRWLVCRGYVEHAREITKPEDRVRQFRSSFNLGFVKATCFILTPAGMALAQDARTRSLSCLAPEAVRPAGQYADADASATVIPHWDLERHVLSVGNRVVKQFRVPSPNQEAVLHAFQRDDWPPYIADPLPAVSAPQHAKVRLHDTIKCLNARQKNRLVRFRGDGQGMGVLWELVAEQAAQQAVQDVGIRRAA